MKIEIDQSGKVEDTAKPTVIAYANGNSRAILIPASNKRQLQELYRRVGKPRLFIPQVFALGVFFSFENYQNNVLLLLTQNIRAMKKRFLPCSMHCFMHMDYRSIVFVLPESAIIREFIMPQKMCWTCKRNRMRSSV